MGTAERGFEGWVGDFGGDAVSGFADFGFKVGGRKVGGLNFVVNLRNKREGDFGGCDLGLNGEKKERE